ncbi:MAG TPA: CoA transferase [Candidatus Limnocylindrales bacterium]|nr:CoA transferase [Candidatus Limnocylindrales bacterium]
MTDGRPLAGIRVLDFTWVGAGALATKLLADLGADVIKIESRARPDNLRLAPPFRDGHDDLEGSGYFASRNSSKRSFALDMRHPGARAIALRLAAASDVVASNFRPGVMDRWGLAYEDVRAANPRVVYLTMPMQGHDGPHAAFTGFGSTISALSGLVTLSGLPDRPGVGTGTHFPDHVPNPGHALVAVLAALVHRARTGEGQAIEVSQLESTVNMIGPAILAASLGPGVGQRRTGNRAPGASPRGVFPSAGPDEWIAISCRGEPAWRALADVLGHPEWTADPRYQGLERRHANEDELEQAIAAATSTHPRPDLVRALRDRGVAAAPVNSSRDILSDEHLAARGYWERLDHPVIGRLSISRPPLVFASGDGSGIRRPPLLGEHTAEVAREVLKLPDEEIDHLVAEGVLA